MRSDFTRSMEARKGGWKGRGTRNGRRENDDDERNGRRSRDTAEREGEGSEGNEMDKYLNLLLELTVTVKVPRSDVGKKRKKRRGKKDRGDDDDDDGGEGSDRIMELSCGWATLNMGTMATRNVGTITLPLSGGTPFSSGWFYLYTGVCVSERLKERGGGV